MSELSKSRRRVLRGVSKAGTTHAGLWLDRYLEYQTDVPGGQDTDDVKRARAKLIHEVAKLRAPKGYRDAATRRLDALSASVTGVKREARYYVVQGRCVVGLGQKGTIEAGITLEHTWGVPYLPGSSLKGVAAASAHLLADDESWRKAGEDADPGASFAGLFGTTEQRGRVVFHDAWCHLERDDEALLAHDIMTVHHPNYYQKEFGDKDFRAPDGMDSPVPVSFITTAKDLTFAIVLEAREEDAQWLDAAWTLLDEGLKTLGIGAKTNAGYGRLVLDETATRRAKEQRERREQEDAAKQAVEQGGPAEHMALVIDEASARIGGPNSVYDILSKWQDEGVEAIRALLASVEATQGIDPGKDEDTIRAYVEGLYKALGAHTRWNDFLRGRAAYPENVGVKKGKELADRIQFVAEAAAQAPITTQNAPLVGEVLSDEEQALVEGIKRSNGLVDEDGIARSFAAAITEGASQKFRNKLRVELQGIAKKEKNKPRQKELEGMVKALRNL